MLPKAVRHDDSLVNRTSGRTHSECDVLNYSDDVESFTGECELHLSLWDDMVRSKKVMTILSSPCSAGEMMATWLFEQTDKASKLVEGKSVCELGAGMGNSGLAAVIARTSSEIMIIFGVRSICNEGLGLIIHLVKP